MERIIIAAVTVVLAMYGASANAATATVDFIGTTTFVGPNLFAPSGVGVTPAPAAYSAIASAGAGDTIVGWFSYETNPGSYSSTSGTPSVSLAYLAGAAPILTGFEISFPGYDFSISRTNLGTVIPGATSVLTQQVRVVNASSVDLFQFDNKWDNRASGGNLQGTVTFSTVDDSASVFGSTALPAVLNLADFNRKLLNFQDSRFVPGTSLGQASMAIHADLRSPAIITPIGLGSTAFRAFGGFEATSSTGSIVGWQTSATGTVDIVDIGAGNSVASLTTGSPVSISQTIATPDSAFEILFDYQFLTTSGSLDVLINDMLLGSIAAPGTLTGALETYTLLVSDPVFRNLSGAELKFLLTDATFSQVYLDNIQAQSVTAVPVPAAFWLLASSLLGLIFTRRGKRRISWA